MGCSPEVSGIFGGSDPSGGGGSSLSSGGTAQGGTGPGPGVSSGSTGASGGTGAAGAGVSTSSSGGGQGDTTSSSSGGANDVTVDCGANTCSVSEGDQCCYDTFLSQTECVDQNAGCAGFAVVTIQCQSPSDCEGGLVCCGQRVDASQPYTGLFCVDECEEPNVLMCDPNGAPCPGADGAQCMGDIWLPPDYFSCPTF